MSTTYGRSSDVWLRLQQRALRLSRHARAAEHRSQVKTLTLSQSVSGRRCRALFDSCGVKWRTAASGRATLRIRSREALPVECVEDGLHLYRGRGPSLLEQEAQRRGVPSDVIDQVRDRDLIWGQLGFTVASACCHRATARTQEVRANR